MDNIQSQVKHLFKIPVETTISDVTQQVKCLYLFKLTKSTVKNVMRNMAPFDGVIFNKYHLKKKE